MPKPLRFGVTAAACFTQVGSLAFCLKRWEWTFPRFGKEDIYLHECLLDAEGRHVTLEPVGRILKA